jgi:hypothetical protein
MKTSFVSILAPIYDWIEDNGIRNDEISESMLVKWATDPIKWVKTTDQHAHRITILQVENYKAELPNDFELIAQVAGKVDPRIPCENCEKQGRPSEKFRNKTTREQMVQWLHSTLERECELELNLKCPRCHETTCDCTTPAIEVDVDRAWEMSHPEIYYGHYTRIGRFGYGPGHDPYSYYTDEFRLMRYATNDYFRTNAFLTDCPNVDCRECHLSFILEPPYIEVDFARGELLLSYLGKKLDENGDLMVPDHPDVFSAIYWHLEYKWWWREYRRKNNQNDFRKFKEAERQREDAIGMARSALTNPEFHEFKVWLDNNWARRIPNYKHHDNINKLSAGQYEQYGKYLDGDTAIQQWRSRRI